MPHTRNPCQAPSLVYSWWPCLEFGRGSWQEFEMCTVQNSSLLLSRKKSRSDPQILNNTNFCGSSFVRSKVKLWHSSKYYFDLWADRFILAHFCLFICLISTNTTVYIPPLIIWKVGCQRNRCQEFQSLKLWHKCWPYFFECMILWAWFRLSSF